MNAQHGTSEGAGGAWVATESRDLETASRFLTGLTVVFGLLTLGLGIVMLVWPHATLVVAAVLIAIQVFAFGIIQIVRSFAEVGAPTSARTLTGLSGALAILLGFLVLRSPLQTLVIIALVIGAWWVFRGVLDIVAGASEVRGHRAASIILGIISVVAGAIVLLQPELSLGVFVIVVGVWMILYGVIVVAAPFLLRRAM
ncbi:HdeD family acid-resistance protein [Rhodococcus sp. ACT016]|uniref:HdeD family acid-resistance protein n=1 Tax=Rhodococcus sp. ACT016 TaxID=3134808 RepID=UPI003D2C679E